MTAPRRTVRATQRFFEDLDRQLPAARGPDGEPSANDFQVLDLLRVIEAFATGWDELPELIPGTARYRILMASGNVVARFAELAFSARMSFTCAPVSPRRAL